MTTTDKERDFEAPRQGAKHPGRYDPRLFQNVDNAGDGFPGLQKALRNWVQYWLHDGVMDQAVDMNSQNINNINNIDVNGNIDCEGNVDINGTSNLDNTDIDGTLDVSGVADFHSNVDMNSNDIQNATFDGLDLSDHSQTEIDILDGATLSTAELNILEGATLSTAELNILDGASSNLTNLTDAEINQLDDIDAVTITNSQWDYLGSLDQDVHTTSTPTFGATTFNGNVDMNDQEIQNLLRVNDKVYFVSTDAEFDSAISDIESNDYMGTIFVTADLTNVQATFNDGSAGFTIDLCGHTLDANGNNDMITISAAKHFTIRNGKIGCSDFASSDTNAVNINETSDNTCTVKNMEITGDGSHGYGIYVQSDNNNIINNNISDCSDGINLTSSSNNTLSGNNCSANNDDGINLDSSSNNTVSGNNCSNNGYGIYLTSSSNNTLSGNNCSNNNYGIYLYSSSNNTISGNNCSANNHEGIELASDSDNNVAVANNAQDGIADVGTGNLWQIDVSDAQDGSVMVDLNKT